MMTRTGCYFTNDFVKGFEKEYQICSCNRHMWSAKSQRVLRARGGQFVLVTKEGKRSLHPRVCSDTTSTTGTIAPDHKPGAVVLRVVKAALLAATYAAMIYSPVLLTLLEPVH